VQRFVAMQGASEIRQDKIQEEKKEEKERFLKRAQGLKLWKLKRRVSTGAIGAKSNQLKINTQQSAPGHSYCEVIHFGASCGDVQHLI